MQNARSRSPLGAIVIAIACVVISSGVAVPAADVAQRFHQLRNFVAEFIDQQDGNEDRSGLNEEPLVILKWCGTFSDIYKVDTLSDAKDKSLIELAFVEHFYSRWLTASGVPPGVIDPVARAFIDTEINRMQEGRYRELSEMDAEFLDVVTSAARDFMKKNKIDRKIGWNNMCGDEPSWKKVTFAAHPSGARISIIPEFYFNLCLTSGVDPEDKNLCRHWREVSSTKAESVLGSYYLHSVWRDEEEVTGLFKIKGGDDGTIFTVEHP
ncbi:hypothetical protein [Rhizobium leguminosarum]|uniref:hypothetical protein n=1 Tax=Rhizobium leguminosarum TaxID=384 RepID=UPI001C97399F|nr:hypothetical protein [Rhizobium leguminosarum]MBY5520933.1 hypothetical protein [Rhizobium leguminosarum]